MWFCWSFWGGGPAAGWAAPIEHCNTNKDERKKKNTWGATGCFFFICLYWHFFQCLWSLKPQKEEQPIAAKCIYTKHTFYFKSLQQSASIKKEEAWSDCRMEAKWILCEILKLDGLCILVLAEHWALVTEFLLTRLSAEEERWILDEMNHQDQWNTDWHSETQPWHKRINEAWLIKTI